MMVAFVTGLVGSLHCAAMCGPLAMAGRPVPYFAGRLLSYSLIGAIFGAIGQHALCRLPVGDVQLVAVALVGVFALWRAVAALRPPPAPRPLPLGQRRRPLLARILGVLPRRGFALGLATGILPCGMLLPAWTLAMGSGGAVAGGATMAAFYAGSAPGLLLPIVARRFAGSLVTRIPRGVQAAAWGGLAIWIAVRPLLAAMHHH